MKKRIIGWLGQFSLFQEKTQKEVSWADSIETVYTFLPPEAHEYLRQLWTAEPFYFKAAQPRKRRYGDFRQLPGGYHLITVNKDLAPRLFLIVLLHEIAHHHIALKYPNRAERKRMGISAHGKEWKNAFSQLLKPLLQLPIFKGDELNELKDLIQYPTATHSRQATFMYSLVAENKPEKIGENIRLISLNEGDRFIFNDKVYQYQKLRRTRILCRRLDDGAQYLFKGITPITPLLNDPSDDSSLRI